MSGRRAWERAGAARPPSAWAAATPSSRVARPVPAGEARKPFAR